MLRCTRHSSHMLYHHKFTMTVQPTYNRFSTLDPPGMREGLGETVHPPRQCPQAARSNGETSGSRGNRGPSPGYPQRDPPRGGSTVALAATAAREEGRNLNTRA